MGWIANTLRRFRASDRPNEITTSKQLDDWLRLMGLGTQSGALVTVDSAQGLAAVAASDRVLSNGIAQLPWRIMRQAGKTREPATDLSVYRVVHNLANPLMTAYQWRKISMRDLIYRGNAYSVKLVTSKGVVGLVRMHPDTVFPRPTPDGESIEFVWSRPDGLTVTLPRSRVLHIWADSDDGIKGISPIQRFRETIGDGLSIRQHGSRFFSNGAKPLGVIEMAGDMGKTAQEAFREDFDSTYAGGDNAHRTLLLPRGLSYKPVSITMDDAQWIEARKTTAREIFGIFGIPPHKAGDLADATFSNVEHENTAFVVDALTPWVVCFEQCIHRDLLGSDPTLYAKASMDGLLRGDAKSRAESLNIQRRAGIINANEWRELEDRNPRTDPGGEEYIVEQNMREQDGRNPQPAGTRTTA